MIVSLPPTPLHSADWLALADRALSGEPLSREQALGALQSPDSELLPLLHAAFQVRQARFGRRVTLYYLQNAKSGLCPEDCGYCSQSRLSTAEIPRYPMLSREELLAGARRAAESGARTYCIVNSGRGPTDREVTAVAEAVREIKETLPLRVCCCLGILKEGQARRLAEAGVNRFNHNLNTAESHHSQICGTHSYQDRLETIRKIKEAGIEACSGGIIGLGESDSDVVELAFALRELEVESIPINFFHPIPGTPLAHLWTLNPRYCLKALCMFRFVNPTSELRIAGGRELHLGPLQPLGLYPANSIFVSDYLTTSGQSPQSDREMIEALGFEIDCG